MLHLIYRLVVQPNTTRAHTFGEAFIRCGGLETLLVLLQREAKAVDRKIPESAANSSDNLSGPQTEVLVEVDTVERCQNADGATLKEQNFTSDEKDCKSDPLNTGGSPDGSPNGMKIERTSSAFENSSTKNLGGISLSISPNNARNNAYNIDESDGIVIAIIGLLGALVTAGHLKFASQAPSELTSNFLAGGLHEGGTMFEDRVSFLLFALQKAFQAAPNRLMTMNVYTALLAASVLLFSRFIHPMYFLTQD